MDQNIQTRPVVDVDAGPDDPADYVLLRRCKRHDYFTSCLPWPQKGPGVELPLGTVAPVIGIGKTNQVFGGGSRTVYETGSTSTVTYSQTATPDDGTSNNQFWIKGDAATGGFPQIYADLNNATAATINSLRQAFQLQRMYERDARGGTRYVELVKSHFGVTSPDLRATRPVYLGGASSPINVTPIPQTSATGATGTPQANLSAYATSIAKGNGFTYSATEHGVVLGLVSVRADLTYQQGLDRKFSRLNREDFYFPALAHLGEQAVYTKEIFCDNSANDSIVFGYQERWAEYRYGRSQITGQLRSTYAQSLDVWHLSQEFATYPTLSPTFIVENPPIARVVAVSGENAIQFVLDAYIRNKAARPMPVYSVPGLIDHF